jgi:uncharacterized protein (TIGR02996 family)
MSRPPHPEVVALLGDIKDNPDDPTPRLVLCDWLEENGDEADAARAEFMRLDLRGGHPDAAGRQQELWQRYKKQWLAPLSRESMHCRFVGGLWFVWCDGWKLEEKLEQGLGELETWAWVGELKLSNTGYHLLYRHLARSPVLRGLPVLDLADNEIEDEGAILLAKSPHLSRLRSLTLRRAGLTNRAALALVKSTSLSGLTHLDLRENNIGPDQRYALIQRFGQGVLLTGA